MEKSLLAYCNAVRGYAERAYKECLREPNEKMRHKFMVPGSTYQQELWDWDSWLTDLAFDEFADGSVRDYEFGSVINFCEAQDAEGRIPINISTQYAIFDLIPGKRVNIHKPCLAQHALFLCKKYGDSTWLRPYFENLQRFISWYENNCLHSCGLFYWVDDFAIGIDNEPCTFYRPDGSCGSIYLNLLMYSELGAMSEICTLLGKSGEAVGYQEKQKALGAAIRRECWDERDGFFYSVDLNLKPVRSDEWLHSGAPRHWDSLLLRVDVFSGALAMWAGLATPEEAERIVAHITDPRTFWAQYGVRSLSALEKMYLIRKSGNPSCWLGPIWVNANYMVFDGFLKYGYTDLARELAVKTVTMLGRDILECGQMHEYYHPDTGEGVHNPGFQSWNLLGAKMAAFLLESDGE